MNTVENNQRTSRKKISIFSVVNYCSPSPRIHLKCTIFLVVISPFPSFSPSVFTFSTHSSSPFFPFVVSSFVFDPLTYTHTHTHTHTILLTPKPGETDR